MGVKFLNPSSKLLSIQIGLAQPLNINGRSVLSAINKTSVASTIKVTKLGLVGDEQADLSVHGGLDKAIYAYPSEHYEFWNKQKTQTGLEDNFAFGSMGENLTLCGLLEKDVYVGDELHFQDCVLCVTTPRQPCFKFNAFMKDKLAAKKMAQSGYSGFYLSVLFEGSLTPGETFTLITGTRQTSIASLFKVAMFNTRNDF